MNIRREWPKERPTMSDSATDRPEFRQAINEAIGWDDRKKVASIYQEHGGRVTDLATDYEALLAIALWGAETALTYADHAGLLVTPAHDAEVAAEAWDEGFSQGWSDAQEAHDVPQEMDQGDWSLCTPNPYRIEREDQS